MWEHELLPNSTSSFQSDAEVSRPAAEWGCALGCSPSLTKAIFLWPHVFNVSHGFGDGLCNQRRHLVLLPALAALLKDCYLIHQQRPEDLR